ncbi:hypothetical protein TNCV_1620971 [Trichonephila clavipes]|nr:hypothetical protein TNCV_1620971 [Trichonephila clavipes]
MWMPEQKVQCVLWITEFKSVTRVHRRVRTKRKKEESLAGEWLPVWWNKRCDSPGRLGGVRVNSYGPKSSYELSLLSQGRGCAVPHLAQEAGYQFDHSVNTGGRVHGRPGGVRVDPNRLMNSSECRAKMHALWHLGELDVPIMKCSQSVECSAELSSDLFSVWFGNSSKRSSSKGRFVEWAQNEIAVVPDFRKRILFSDEAHFWLNSYVNKQNCHIWSEANPQVYVETPLYPEKLTVWCALWAGGILLQKR